MASRRESQSGDESSGGQSSSLKARGKSIAKETVQERGRMMLKEVLKEAMVEAIEEADRYERQQSESAQDVSDEETTDQAESGQSSDSSSSRLSWIVPLGIGVAAVYLWQRQMSGEEGVQKSITEWKGDDESSDEESGESALSDEDEDAGYGTAGESGMQSPDGVDDDESGRADTDSDDEATETTETA